MILLRKTFNPSVLLMVLVGFAFSNVTVSLDDVEVDGYTAEIIVPVNLTNPNDAVGGFQFDVIALPTLAELTGVEPEDADNFSADFNVFDDGSGRIVFYSNGPDGIAAGGDGVVLNLHFDGSVILSALLDLDMFSLAVSDEDGNVLESSAEGGSIIIGNVVTISATSDTGDVDTTLFLDINLDNPGVVGGLQFDLYDTPDYLDVTGFSTTDRSVGFSVEYTVLESGLTRVIMYDAENGNIESGNGPILNMEIVVHDNAYNSNVGVNFDNVVITDETGGTYWVAGADSGTVTVSPGYIEEPYNLEAQDSLDAQVLLNWEAPIGPIFSRPVSIIVVTDFWGEETTWQITDNETGEIVEAYTDPPLEDETEYIWDLELLFGSYTFTIFDSWGDGIYGPGGYAIFIEDEEVYSNIGIGWSGSDESVVFDVTAGRFLVTNRSFEQPLPDKSMVNAETMSAMNMTLGEPTFVTSGSFTPWDIDEVENTRPVDIDNYKVYRSMDEVNYDEIAEVGGDVTTYLDEGVTNSTTYYYYVTAIYPDGSESGPTNVVSATPVEWVELWMDDGSSLTGQRDTLDFYINNETNLGFFYFEIVDYPDVINPVNILSTERTSNCYIEIAPQDNGTTAISGTCVDSPLSAGDGAVCRAIFYPDADEAMTVSLSYSNSSAIKDVNFDNLKWTSESATYEVGIETQYVTLTGGYGDDGGNFTSSLILENTQPVYGLQLDIAPYPLSMMGTEVNESNAHDFSDWDVSGMVIGNYYRVTLVNNAHNSPINPGISHIADITFEIPAGTPDSSIVVLNLQDAEITGINDWPMHTEGIPGEVYIGIPPAAYTIQNTSGVLTPGGTGTFEVHLNNTELVALLEFTLVDIPESMTVDSITPVGRFSSAESIDGWEEEDGSYYFLGYDFNGIQAGSGPILEFYVQFDDNLNNSSIIMSMASYATGDLVTNPLTTVFHGFGQFTEYFVALDEEVSIPGEFALHPNFPNPFNPTTMIAYDLPDASDVQLDIYDLMGRNINTVVNQNQSVGRHFVIWNANDYLGNQVSAGVYLYRLQAGNKIFTRKMVLMK
jgi:hypothetical protein